MAKTFGKLKKGDIIYTIRIYTYTTGADKGNCDNAYATLGMSFDLATYPTISEIINYEVTDVRPSLNGSDNVLLYVESRPGDRMTLISPYRLNKIFKRQFIAGVDYQIFAVDVDSLKEETDKIIHAMEVVNRNIMVVKSNKYKEMLEKLKTL